MVIIFLVMSSLVFYYPTPAQAGSVVLDTTFDGDGIVTHNNAAGGNNEDRGYSMQIQSDGKIVAAGHSYSGATNLRDMTVWRFNSNGSLDTTFDSDGIVTHNGAAGGNDNDAGLDVNILSDGKIVVAGYSYNASGNDDLVVWRFNSNGSLDTTFDSDGYVTHHNAAGGNGYDRGFSSEIQSDGKIVVAGASANSSGDWDLAIWRFNSNGSLDTTFDSDGYVTHHNAAGGNSNDLGYSVQIQSDGKYVVAGSSRNASANEDLAVWRFNSNGSLDTTFDSDGYATHDSAAGGSNADEGHSLQIQSDGKIIMAGNSQNISGNSDLAIWRYNSNGSLDTTFNGAGYVIHNNAAGGNGNDYGRSIQIQSDGKLVADGYSDSGVTTVDDLAIWRYVEQEEQPIPELPKNNIWKIVIAVLALGLVIGVATWRKKKGTPSEPEKK
jgi:uncharacterized delta-60 repeat protein